MESSSFIIREGTQMRKAALPVCFFLATVLLFRYGPVELGQTYIPSGRITPLWLGTFACGACCLVAVYSLSLYLQKRSERYLLWLFVIAAIASLRTFIASVDISVSYIDAGMIGPAFDVFTVVICFALCFWLTDTRLSGKWNVLLTTPGLLLIYLVLLAVRYAIPGTLTQKLIGCLPYMAALGCLGTACLQQKDGAYVLLFGMGARYGLRGYFLTVTEQVAHTSTLSNYISASQLDFLIFVLCCLFIINAKFVSKFNKSDSLVEELARINASLDTIVAQRTAELQLANETIVAQQKHRHSLMANICHDLRSPIFVLQGYMDMQESANDAAPGHASVMRERLSFLSRLIEDLFLVAKLEENEITFDRDVLDASAICAQALNAMHSMACAQNVRLQLNAQPGGMIEGDSFRLMQAMQNLLENALQHMPSGGDVFVECMHTDYEVQISVRDTGRGIPPEELPNVFERYYKRPRRHSVSSSGLGLNIVNQIVKHMGGRIEVYSEQGAGSRFIMLFPEIVEGEAR